MGAGREQALRSSRQFHVAIVSALAFVVVGQAAWTMTTTSGTYDETTYLRFGRAWYLSHDARPLAEWGIAPLPVLLTSGVAVLAGEPSYPRAITLARVAAMTFFGIPLVAITYWILLNTVDRSAAIGGTAIVSLSPNLLAHVSLATTDICFVVATLAVLAALAHHAEMPSTQSRIVLAATLAVALAAKYSALQLFLIVPLVLAASRGSPSIVRRTVDAIALSAAAFVAALLFVWVLHAFAMVPFGLPPIDTVSLPGSIVGIARQVHHQSLGEPAFLLGRRSTSGWWYYMPVALAMKSTPAELIVAACALIAVLTRPPRRTPSGLVWRIAAVVFGAFALVNHLALGIRYVLVLIPLATFLAAEWWTAAVCHRRWRLGAVVALVALQLFSALSIAPHDLSYFNWFAGGPERGYLRLADSNVDWGQDLPALGTELRRLRARRALFSYFGTAPPDAYGVHADRWEPGVREPFDRWDWVAISATNVDGVFLRTDPFVDFRSLTPDARAGYSILLYSTVRPEVRRAMTTAAVRLQ